MDSNNLYSLDWYASSNTTFFYLQISSSLIECYKTRECWYKYPGVDELLDSMSRRNIVLGIISNFDERLDSILQSLDIRRQFHFVLTSYETGVEKPNAAIFKVIILFWLKCTPRKLVFLMPDDKFSRGKNWFSHVYMYLQKT